MNPTVRSFFLGFIKIHILHHAANEEVYGLWLIEELRHHGYNLSPGTLYPILHSLEGERLLRSRSQAVNGKIRKYYRTTATGQRTLRDAKERVRQLVREITEEPTK
jgi:PadR family transcriptional regulator, regulatory protein PadR